jgi:hypothetical protein
VRGIVCDVVVINERPFDKGNMKKLVIKLVIVATPATARNSEKEHCDVERFHGTSPSVKVQARPTWRVHLAA